MIVVSLLDFGSESLKKAIVVLNVARIVRVVRVCHVVKHFTTVRIMALAVKASLRELTVLIALLASAAVFYASVLFYTEVNVNNIDHIPLGIWWAIVTMTTVGYGDLAPISFGGYIVGVLCAISGILIVALPIPVVVSNFNKYYTIAQQCEILSRQRTVGNKSGACNVSFSVKEMMTDTTDDITRKEVHPSTGLIEKKP